MLKNLQNIVIVGGGSAGWMSASMLIQTFPAWNITVIESLNIPTVGVGESTLGGIRNFCHYLKINEKDFMKETDASYKLSIKFTDFYDKNAGSFHYPFGTPYLKDSADGLRDWFWKKTFEPDTPVQDFVQGYFPAAALFENNKYSPNHHGKFDNFDSRMDVAYHFDATKFGIWLRDRYCKPKGVNHIQATVVDIPTSDNGIECLILDNGQRITADLFVDCSGFKSLLLEGALNTEFISYEEMLPNNRAWACQVPYKDQEKEIEGFTNCTAIENGWCWNTPLWSRLGTGYVYSDKYASPDQALEEFKNYLCSDKMKIPRTREEIETLKFRDVPFKVGIHRQTFVKNVVAIGLSAGFLEPLESNGLFSVHEFLFKLCKILKRGHVTQWDRDCYNTATYGMFQNFAEFVALHYALTIRNDTKYWTDITNKQFDKKLDQLNPTMSVGFHNFIHRSMFTGQLDSEQGISYISTGMHRFIMDEIDIAVRQGRVGNQKNLLAPFFAKMEMNKQKWQRQAEKELSLYDYLKKYIY